MIARASKFFKEFNEKIRKEREDLLGGSEAASSSPNLNKIVPTGLQKEDNHKQF